VVDPASLRESGIALRRQLGIPVDAPVLGVLAGSRRHEVLRMMPIYTEAVRLLKPRLPSLQVLCPTVSTVTKDVKALANRMPVPVTVLPSHPDNKYAALSACDAALATSGTVTVELAAAGVPMVVAYVAHPITAWLARRLAVVKFVSMPNLLLQRRAVEEFVFDECSPAALADALEPLFHDSGRREEQVRDLDRSLEVLAGGLQEDSSLVAARTILDICSLTNKTKDAPPQFNTSTSTMGTRQSLQRVSSVWHARED